MATDYALKVEGLRKFFGDVKAVNGLSFMVHEGEIFGLLGPNGAGKTTTLRIIATLLAPSEGKVTVLGKDVVKEKDQVRELISYLPEEAGAYKYLTGIEYLNFMAKVYGKSDEAVLDGVKLSGLGNALKRYVSTYSKGMKRRLQVARALMVRPKLAILDEPTSGLDVVHAVFLRRAIREYVRKYRITVILSSHNMLEVEDLCDRVALMNKGRMIVEGSPEDLMRRFNSKNLEEVFIKVVDNALGSG